MNLEARRDAVESLSTLLRRDDVWLSEHHATKVAERVVANALLVRGYLAPVVEEDKTLLRRQPTASYDDVYTLEDECHLLERELRDKSAMLAAARRRALPEYDPDEVAQDREDTRDRERRHDEHADALAVDAMGKVS